MPKEATKLLSDRKKKLISSLVKPKKLDSFFAVDQAALCALPTRAVVGYHYKVSQYDIYEQHDVMRGFLHKMPHIMHCIAQEHRFTTQIETGVRQTRAEVTEVERPLVVDQDVLSLKQGALSVHSMSLGFNVFHGFPGAMVYPYAAHGFNTDFSLEYLCPKKNGSLYDGMKNMMFEQQLEAFVSELGLVTAGQKKPVTDKYLPALKHAYDFCCTHNQMLHGLVPSNASTGPSIGLS